jgi:hypothetical protein
MQNGQAYPTHTMSLNLLLMRYNSQLLPLQQVDVNADKLVKDLKYASTCSLITGPRSASGSVPALTLIALARSTSLSSLEKDQGIKNLHQTTYTKPYDAYSLTESKKQHNQINLEV